MLAPTVASAGDGKNVVIAPEPVIKPYELTVSMPAWAPWIVGQSGVAGVTTDVYAGVDEIIKHLDMIAAMQAELRFGKVGLLFDGLYTKTTFGAEPDSLLVSSAELGLKQAVLEGAVAYRIYESDRAWIDVLAGARWLYLGNSLTLTANDSGVSQVADQLSSELVDRAVSSVRSEVRSRLTELLTNLGPSLEAEVQNRVAERLSSSDLGLVRGIDDRLRPLSDFRSEGLGVGDRVSGSPRVQRAIRDYAKAAASARIEQERAQASSTLATARASIRARAEERLSEAEERLAEAIEDQLQEAIPEEELTASESWVDPFIGVRARYDISEKWYALGRADIGGFGIGSDIAWNAYAALGYQMRPNMTTELGYRHYVVDYANGGFIFDVTQTGPVLALGITF